MSPEERLYWRSFNKGDFTPYRRPFPQSSFMVPTFFGTHPREEHFSTPRGSTTHIYPGSNSLTTSFGFIDSPSCPIQCPNGITPPIIINSNARLALTRDQVLDIIKATCRDLNLDPLDLPASEIDEIRIFVVSDDGDPSEIVQILEETLQHPNHRNRIACIIPDGNLPLEISDRIQHALAKVLLMSSHLLRTPPRRSGPTCPTAH